MAAVLGAIYPPARSCSPRYVLKERIAQVQSAGLALALVAAGMLALA